MEKHNNSKSNQKKEKAVIIGSALLVLAAMTVTALYVNSLSVPEHKLVEDIAPEESFHYDFQVVDSGAVDNPSITDELETTESVESDRPNSTIEEKSTGGTKATFEDSETETSTEEILDQTVMSEMVENSMLSFDGSRVEWPMESHFEVIIPYSMENLVYFETLDQYKLNEAMIIQAELGTPVYAIAPGKITNKYWDEKTGWTYEMDMGGGFKSYYGQLEDLQKETEIYVAEGDILGYIANPTKYFAKEGTNLYFAMTKDNTPIYPLEFVE